MGRFSVKEIDREGGCKGLRIKESGRGGGRRKRGSEILVEDR